VQLVARMNGEVPGSKNSKSGGVLASGQFDFDTAKQAAGSFIPHNGLTVRETAPMAKTGQVSRTTKTQPIPFCQGVVGPCPIPSPLGFSFPFQNS